MENVEDMPQNDRCSIHTALDKIRDEMNELSEHELLQQNVVAVDVVTTVRGIWKGLLALRPLMQQLPDFKIENLDRLDLYAVAFLGAHARYRTQKMRNREPAAVRKEGLALRGQLVSDLRTLAERKLVSPELLENLDRGRGYRQIAKDLLLLATIFRAHEHIVTGKCATTAEEIARAEELTDKLTVVVSHRRKPLEAEVKALDDRKRAFTLFFRAYGQIRRAVQYLRYDIGDADRIAPPLTGKRKRSKKSADKSESVDPGMQLELTSSGNASIEAVVPESSAFANDPGFPGADPFLH